MPRTLLAALALACVCSPAIALGIAPGQPGPALGFLAFIVPAIALLAIGPMLRATRRTPVSALFISIIGTLVLMTSGAMAGGALIDEGLPATGSFVHGLAFGLLLLGALALTIAVCIAGRPRLPVLGILVAALLAIIAGPAFAAEAVAGNSALVLPWGRWLSDLAQASFDIFLILLPPLAAWAAQAIRKRYIWAGLVLTQTRLEQAGTALAEHGLSAVKGAVKGRQINVELGSRVIAAGLGRAAEAMPRIVWEQAGGAEGVAKLILRKLDLDEEADERSVLGPALASFQASGAPRSASH